MNQSKDQVKTQKLSKKIISTVVSVCTAFPKAKRDLDFNEWQRIEYRSSKISDGNYQIGRGQYL